MKIIPSTQVNTDGDSKPVASQRRIWKYSPYIILALSLIATLSFWLPYDATLKERARLIYVGKTQNIKVMIVERLQKNEQILRGAAGLIYASITVTRDEWRRYVETLNLSRNNPGIQGVGFSAWLTPSEREENIRTIRAEGFPHYTIHPAGERPVYTSIIYLEPFDWRNQRAFGFDMFTEAKRKRAMEKARDSGETTIAAKVILVQETDKDVQSGMLMYVPVYRKGMPLDTIEERQAAIRGYAYSPVRFTDFICARDSRMPEDIAFDVYAVDREQPDALMFSSLQVGKTILPQEYKPAYHSIEPLNGFGEKWIIVFKTTPKFTKELNLAISYAVLAGGIVVSSLLTLIAFIVRAASSKTYEVARAIAESEARFKGAFQHSVIGMAMVSPAGNWIKVNDSLCVMLGYTESELLAMTFQNITYPDDLPTETDCMRKLLVGEVGAFKMEIRFIGKQGNIIWVLLAGTLVRDGDRVPQYFVVQIENTSDRKQALEQLHESRERFSAAFNSAPLMFAISNLEDETYLDVNQRLLDISGFSREDVIGQTSIKLGWLSEADCAMMKETLLRDGRISDWELSMTTKSGKTVLCNYWGEIISLAGRKCLLSIALDITEHRKVEEQFLQAQKLESIGRLAGGVAHDFNNSLYCVLGFAELIYDKLDEKSPLRADVEQIRLAAQQAADVTKQLLAFSRKQVIQPRPTDVDSLILKQQKMLHRIIGEDIRIKLELKAESALAVVDPSQLQQILTNLCVNARDAMPQGGPLVIESQVVKAPLKAESPVIKAGAPFVRISVRDKGVGMTPEIISQIFEPFFTTKEAGKGTGLGLPVVLGIVQQHGGWVDVASQPGEGTSFDVFLPCAEVPSESAPEENAPPPRGKGECVLLVEDDPTVREIGATRLRNLGYSVIAAESLKSGWDQYRSAAEPVRVLLSDVVLPDGSGVTLAERIAADDPSVRIAFSSGYADERSRVQEIGARNWAFITKPYNMLAMAKLINSLLAAK